MNYATKFKMTAFAFLTLSIVSNGINIAYHADELFDIDSLRTQLESQIDDNTVQIDTTQQNQLHVAPTQIAQPIQDANVNSVEISFNPTSPSTTEPQSAQPTSPSTTEPQSAQSTSPVTTESLSSIYNTTVPTTSYLHGTADITVSKGLNDSDLDTLYSLGMIDTNKKRINDKLPENLSESFSATALSSFKSNVYSHFTKIPTGEYYDIIYSSERNIIFVILNKDYSTTGFDLTRILPNISITDIDDIVVMNEDHHKFSFTMKDNKPIIQPTGGYNGFVEILVDGIPIVIMNHYRVEPIITTDLTDALNIQKAEAEQKNNRPTINVDDFELEDDIYDSPSFIDPASDFNSNNGFFSGNFDTKEEVDSKYNEQKNQINKDYEDSLKKLKEEIEAKKKQNELNKPDIAISSTDTSQLLDGVLDTIETDTSATIDTSFVYDEVGNNIDVVEETRITTPAIPKEYTAITIDTSRSDDELPLSFFIGIFCTLTFLLSYIYYYKMYAKEYVRYLETRGLLGVIDLSSIGDYQISDTTADIGNLFNFIEEESIEEQQEEELVVDSTDDILNELLKEGGE